MIKSMTGYGSAKGSSGNIEIAIEVKSVNNRYLDCSVKIPRVFIAFEEPIKTLVGKYTTRGKVDVFVSVDFSNADDVEIKLNRPLAKAYLEALHEMDREYNLTTKISALDLSRFPDVLKAEKKEADTDKLSMDILSILEQAMDSYNDMRKKEGQKLFEDMSSRLDIIEELTKTAEEISPKTVEEYRKKLHARMQEVLHSTTIDEARILTEAAIFADKIAINEETVRLRSHIEQLREMLESSEPIGRKIDFIVQEFNREANTIGSKGNDAQMARVTVDMKAEIEKIREQAQNIE